MYIDTCTIVHCVHKSVIIIHCVLDYLYSSACIHVANKIFLYLCKLYYYAANASAVVIFTCNISVKIVHIYIYIHVQLYMYIYIYYFQLCSRSRYILHVCCTLYRIMYMSCASIIILCY